MDKIYYSRRMINKCLKRMLDQFRRTPNEFQLVDNSQAESALYLIWNPPNGRRGAIACWNQHQKWISFYLGTQGKDLSTATQVIKPGFGWVFHFILALTPNWWIYNTMKRDIGQEDLQLPRLHREINETFSDSTDDELLGGSK